jgi:hypothetical protein
VVAEEEVLSLKDLLLRIRKDEQRIFVRAQISGHWQSVALANLPDELWAEHVARFIALRLLDGSVPVRVKTEGAEATSEGESFEAGA